MRFGGVLGGLEVPWGPQKLSKTNEKSPFLLLVPTWSHLVSTWSPLCPHQVVFGRLGGVLEASWAVLGASWGRLGASRVRLGGVFGGLEVPWDPPKKLVKPLKINIFAFDPHLVPFGLHLVPIRSPSGGLGASWGRLGGVLEGLGPYWGHLGGDLGASWVRLGASWGVLRSFGVPQKACKTYERSAFLLLVPTWGVLEGRGAVSGSSWGASWGVLGASWVRLGGSKLLKPLRN